MGVLYAFSKSRLGQVVCKLAGYRWMILWAELGKIYKSSKFETHYAQMKNLYLCLVLIFGACFAVHNGSRLNTYE
ncbi:MAG: hypothetical protein CMJ72_15060 [Planctomycetaceae bacterium]|nr:hypothetical protein [Planctomycetaceae bacterium]